MITTSDETDKLDAAMAKVNGMVGGLKRSATNPFTKSKYPNLEDVWDVLRPALREAGLSLSQHPLSSDKTGVIRLETRIAKDGQWMRSDLEMPIQKWDPQGWGAGLTYAKRYALSAIFGLAEDDDDGNTASGRRPDGPETRPEPQRDVRPAQAPQKAVRAPEPKFDNELDEALEGITRKPVNMADTNASYKINFGRLTGKRIGECSEKDLSAMVEWVKGRHAEKAQVPKNVQEAYDHAVRFLGL